MGLAIENLIIMIIFIIILFFGLIMIWVNFICIEKLKKKVNQLSKILSNSNFRSDALQNSNVVQLNSQDPIEDLITQSNTPIKIRDNHDPRNQDKNPELDQHYLAANKNFNLRKQCATKPDRVLKESIVTNNNVSGISSEFKNVIPKKDQSDIKTNSSVEQQLGSRLAVWLGGILLCICSVVRIGYLDLLLYNPLFVEIKVYGWPIFNSLLLSFGVPLVWTWLAVQQLKSNHQEQWTNYAHWVMLTLLLALVSFNIRYLFNGECINPNAVATNAELYSYSVAWLCIGIFMLVFGIVKHDKLLRYTSMGLILITVLKVFLYDISELQGLYRVFSFLGLGLSLIVLNWIYTKFVFNDNNLKSNK